MTLAESLLYSGLSALFSVLCWFIRFAWKRKKKRAVKPVDGEAPADDAQEVMDVPFSICGNVMKGVGESAIDALAEAEPRRCRCCRCLCCCPL